MDEIPRTQDIPEVMNRMAFEECVERNYDKYFDGTHAICYLRIHNLKYYNRLHGVECGDDALFSIVRMIERQATDALIARYAGHGLCFLMSLDVMESIPGQANALLPTYGEVNGLEAKMGHIVARRPLGTDQCLRRALYACGEIELMDGVSSCAFEGAVERAFDRRAYIVDHLDEAIERGEIQAWAQPIVRVLTGRVCEVEVLARWQSARYGFLYPDEFIPTLEQHQLIHKLDLEVFRRACAQWCDAKTIGWNVPFGINLSRLDFELCDIFGQMREVMDRYQVPVDQVHVEVTESSVIKDRDVMTEGLERFREAGFEVFMDDFGSGYSSLGALADLYFDVVKIDKALLDGVEASERSRAVLADTISMVKRLGMQTLVEGVETERQLDFLRAVGCEKAQGYLFGRPAAHDTTMRMLGKQHAKYEDPVRSPYLDAVGQVNLLEGVSASIDGVEAAAFRGRLPIAVLELRENHLHELTSNIAFQRLVERIGYPTFDKLAIATSKVARRIIGRAVRTACAARDTGEQQSFDFIAGGIFCSTTMRLVASSKDRHALLNVVTSVERAPQITEHTLLEGVLETSHLCFFWKDVERRFLGANQRFLDYFGFKSTSDILGKTDEDMGWHERNQPYHDNEVRVLAGETISAAPGICKRGGQYRDILATKRPLYSHGAIVGLVGFFEDIGPHVEDGED